MNQVLLLNICIGSLDFREYTVQNQAHVNSSFWGYTERHMEYLLLE